MPDQVLHLFWWVNPSTMTGTKSTVSRSLFCSRSLCLLVWIWACKEIHTHTHRHAPVHATFIYMHVLFSYRIMWTTPFIVDFAVAIHAHRETKLASYIQSHSNSNVVLPEINQQKHPHRQYPSWCFWLLSFHHHLKGIGNCYLAVFGLYCLCSGLNYAFIATPSSVLSFSCQYLLMRRWVIWDGSIPCTPGESPPAMTSH